MRGDLYGPPQRARKTIHGLTLALETCHLDSEQIGQLRVAGIGLSRRSIRLRTADGRTTIEETDNDHHHLNKLDNA